VPADYKSRGNGRGGKPLPGFVWLLTGLSIGLFVAFLVYLDGQPDTSNTFTAAVKKELNKIKPTKKKSNNSANKQEPKFNFYTILPELEVLIPDSETRPPETIKSSNGDSQLDSEKEYILQAGSFQNKNDAEKLKASLALLGYEASVQNVTINRDAWHRVRIGPYTNTKELYKTISLLQKHDITAMPMELKHD